MGGKDTQCMAVENLFILMTDRALLSKYARPHCRFLFSSFFPFIFVLFCGNWTNSETIFF